MARWRRTSWPGWPRRSWTPVATATRPPATGGGCSRPSRPRNWPRRGARRGGASMPGTDPERAEADDLAEPALTVTGEPVRLRLPPRVPLADALRDHLG